MLTVVFFVYFAFGAVETFFSSFTKTYLGKSESEAALIILAYPIPMIASAPLAGIIGQKLGRKRALQLSFIGLIVLLSIMSFIVVPTKNVTYVVITLILIAILWMNVVVNVFPIIWNLAPEGMIGSYTGIYYMINQLAYILSPISMGFVFDTFGAGLGNDKFIFMFPFVLISVIVAFCMLFFVKRGEILKRK